MFLYHNTSHRKKTTLKILKATGEKLQYNLSRDGQENIFRTHNKPAAYLDQKMRGRCQ